MAEFLLEVRSDEIPARLLEGGMRQLAVRIFEDLMGRGLAPREIVSGLTPRRLMLGYQGLPEHEPDREHRDIGPPKSEAYDEDGEPTEALLGFAERVGAGLDELEVRKTEKGEYMTFLRLEAGRPAGEVLAEIVSRTLAEIRWRAPKLRRGEEEPTWIRPVRGLVALLDDEVLPIELDGVAAGRATAGHPILSPGAFEVEGVEDYVEKLHERGIEVSFQERRRRLEELLEERAAELGGKLHESPELLRLLTLRCEIPAVVAGRFDAEYLDLPQEVIVAALEERQSAFALFGDGEVLPRFLTAMDREDDPRGLVERGQERAAAGRLDDARFHYETDRRQPLAERARRLDQLAFHPRLSHLAAKSTRVRSLVEILARELGCEEEAESAAQAAGLLKADLTTAMVRDFATLRGRLGGIYAREEGYVEDVWQAIYDQYLPLGADDAIPRGRCGRLVAVADRLDTLVGYFGIGSVPTGSRDPAGLRRLAQGLLHILIEAEMALDLDLVAAQAVLLYNEEERVLKSEAEAVVTALRELFSDRLRHLLGRRGFAYDEIEATMAVGSTHLPDLAARIAALKKVRSEPTFHTLVLSARRIFNIVRDSPEFELQPELLELEAEMDLYADLVDVRRAVDEAADRRDYEACLRAMVDLVPGLERFFAEVLVMDENESLRQNRMALLQATRRVFWRTARLKEMAAEKVEREPSPSDTRVPYASGVPTTAVGRPAAKADPGEQTTAARPSKRRRKRRS